MSRWLIILCAERFNENAFGVLTSFDKDFS